MNFAKRLPAIILLAISFSQLISSSENKAYANQITEEEVIELGGSVRPRSLQTTKSSGALTSRDLRRESTLQLAFHATPIFPVIQTGVDLDIVLNEDLTIGLSRTNIAMILMDYEESIENTTVHFKQFLGNSFYIKPSAGIQTKTESGWMSGTTVTRSLALQVEVGNEWFWTENFGVNLSYLGVGVKYDDKNSELQEIGLFPSVRLFGAF